jgi:hypothetical protein
MREADLALRRQMARLVRAWQASNESRATFTRRHGLSLAKFGYWQQRVGRPRPRAASGLAPVHVVATPGPEDAGVLEVVLAQGDRVIVRAGASGPVVRHVLSALRRRC